MFPVGHAFYSSVMVERATPLQLLGSVLPDARTTGAFGGVNLHDPRVVRDLERQCDTAQFQDLFVGVRHHLQLDHRSHDAWAGRGGYAFEKQTPELLVLTHRAFGTDDGQTARKLAHNVVESACDVLIANEVDVHEQLVDSFAAVGIEEIAAVIANALGQDPFVSQERLRTFLCLFEPKPADVGAMVKIWRSLVPYFPGLSFDESAAAAAIEMALEIARIDFLTVLTP